MQGSAFLAFSPCYRGECRLLLFLLSLLSLEKSYHREELQILPNLREYSLSGYALRRMHIADLHTLSQIEYVHGPTSH